MLTKLYLQVLHLANQRFAPVALSIVAFTESIFFPIPPDTLLIPMALANRKKAFKFAMLTTFFSVAGGIVGYFIGFFFWTKIGQQIIEVLGFTNAFTVFSNMYERDGILILLLGALTPFPFKVIAILSGVLEYPLLIFVLITFVFRGLRFYLITTIIYVWGEKIDLYLKKYVNIGFFLVLLILCTGYLYLK